MGSGPIGNLCPHNSLSCSLANLTLADPSLAREQLLMLFRLTPLLRILSVNYEFDSVALNALTLDPERPNTHCIVPLLQSLSCPCDEEKLGLMLQSRPELVVHTSRRNLRPPNDTNFFHQTNEFRVTLYLYYSAVSVHGTDTRRRGLMKRCCSY
jgi:hypothetical protein